MVMLGGSGLASPDPPNITIGEALRVLSHRSAGSSEELPGQSDVVCVCTRTEYTWKGSQDRRAQSILWAESKRRARHHAEA